MQKCFQRVQTLISFSQRTLSIPTCSHAIHMHSSVLSPSSLLSQPSMQRNVLKSSFTNQFISIRTAGQFNVDGNEDLDIDSLFSDDVEPSFYDNENFSKNRQDSYAESDFGSSLNEKKYEQSDLKLFPKDFYQESPISVNRSQTEINEFYDNNSIKVFGNDPPKPMLSFEETNFPDHILDKLSRQGIKKPTPIQSITWPVTLSGRNVVGIAQTGSGKTLSFLIPAVIHMKAQPAPQRGQGPIALVLCPTRELAKQCGKVARDYFGHQVRTTCLFGGGERARQLEDLSHGCDLAIATPGRLMDLLESREVSMKDCTFLVLDEADRMLDMGFEPQIRKIINQIRPDRQVTMWSATWPKEVQTLATRYLLSNDDPVHIKVGSADLTANRDVQQKFFICDSLKKRDIFLDLLKSLKDKFYENELGDGEGFRKRQPKFLVFCNTKRTCDYVANQVHRGGIRAEAIHGNLTQRMRDNVMHSFRSGRTSVMVATDVAARGLDVHNIDYVINYDAPADCVSYIHRIGRTGRGGKKGQSVTLLTEADGAIVPDIIQALRDIDHPVDEKLQKMQAWYRKKKNTMKARSTLMKERSAAYSNRGERTSNYRSYHNRDYDDDRYTKKQDFGDRAYGYEKSRGYQRRNRRYDDDNDF